MPFTAKLPTFNLSVTLHRLTAMVPSLVWTPDLTPVKMQLQFPSKNAMQVWLPDYDISRGTRDTQGYGAAWQTGEVWVYALFPRQTNVRDRTDLEELGFFGQRDFLQYTSTATTTGSRQYWIDQVEPRFEGFPNEHVAAILFRKGTFEG